MAVCDKTYQILTNANGPYGKDIIPVPCYEDIPLESAQQFNCKNKAIRHPKETKGLDDRLTSTNNGAACCEPEECC